MEAASERISTEAAQFSASKRPTTALARAETASALTAASALREVTVSTSALTAASALREVTVQERIAPSGQPKAVLLLRPGSAPARPSTAPARPGTALRTSREFRAKYECLQARRLIVDVRARLEASQAAIRIQAVARGLLARRTARRRRLAQRRAIAPAPPPPRAAPQLHSPRPRPAGGFRRAPQAPLVTSTVGWQASTRAPQSPWLADNGAAPADG